MAEERNTGLARAPEPLTTDPDATKEQLQRRMEEARESITQTVAEIKETVATQYQQVRESISETLDWREQFRRRPVAFSVGALVGGFLLGYSVGGAFSGGGDAYEDEDDEDVRASISASSTGAFTPAHSYAAQPIIGGAHGVSSLDAPARETAPLAGAAVGPSTSRSLADVGPDSRQAYSAPLPPQGAASGAAQPQEEEEKPGLLQRVRDSGVIEKFKESKAYDRLQDELSSLGDRFIEELSTTARNVVVPALLGKLKDLIGIDLSTQREVAQRSRLEREAATSGGGTQSASGGVGASSSTSAGASSGAGSYGTSENRGYGAP